jgi:hypothetical protein
MSLYQGTIGGVVLQLLLLDSVVQHPDAQSRCLTLKNHAMMNLTPRRTLFVATQCLRR